MKSTNDAANLNLLKIKIYKRTLILAAIVIVLVWGISIRNNTTNRFESYVYPLALLFSPGISRNFYPERHSVYKTF